MVKRIKLLLVLVTIVGTSPKQIIMEKLNIKKLNKIKKTLDFVFYLI